jgi:hypothetical protein
MDVKIPEVNKVAGVCYAVTNDGLELPVVDITHPAFAFDTSEGEVNTRIEQFLLSMQRLAQTPPAVLQSMLAQSLLMRGMLLDSANTYTSGIMTYLNKLGPDNLGEGYASPLDRQWAGSLTPLTFRWRMRDVARLLADGLSSALAARPAAPLHLVNIGGGVSADSLNGLILLYKEHPELLAGRQVMLHVLDLDQEGPCFGGRALDVLQAEGGPLHGLQAVFEYIPYNWSETTRLRRMVDDFAAQQAVVAGSSEGGLFEFAGDEQIIANLQALHAAPHDTVMVGPVVRDASTLDPRLKMTEHVKGRPSIRYLGLETFGQLAAQAGWRIDRSLDGPMHQVVSLKQA